MITADVSASEFLELSRQSRHFREEFLDDDSIAFGQCPEWSVVVHPSTSAGFAFVSIWDRGVDVHSYLRKPVRRDVIAMIIDESVPSWSDLEWRFGVTEDRWQQSIDDINAARAWEPVRPERQLELFQDGGQQ